MSVLSTSEAGRYSKSAWRRTWVHIGIIIAAATIFMVSIWMFFLYETRTERQAVIESAGLEMNNLTAAFAAEVTSRLEAVAVRIDTIASEVRVDPNFDLYAWAGERSIYQANPQSAEILSPDGKIISTTLSPHPEPIDLSDRDFFTGLLHESASQIYVGHFAAGKVPGTHVIPISRRVEATDGRLLGVIVVYISPSDLTVMNKAVDLGDRGSLRLIGNDRVVRVRFSKYMDRDELHAGRLSEPPPILLVSDLSPHWYIHESSLDHVVRMIGVQRLTNYPLYVSCSMELDLILWRFQADERGGFNITIAIILTVGSTLILLIIEICRRTDRDVKLAIEQATLSASVNRTNQVQAQLRSSEKRLRDIIELMSDWFWEQDAELRFVQVGETSPLHEGADPKYIGKQRWEIYDTSGEPLLWERHKRDLLDRKPFKDFRFSVVVGPEDKLYYVSISGIPVFNDAGEFDGYRGTGRDVTAEVEAKKELRESKERAEKAETLLRDAVESIPADLVIFDHEDRFVLCNEFYRQTYQRACSVDQQVLVPGVLYDDMLRLVPSDSLAGRSRYGRESRNGVEQCLKDGSWYRIIDRRMKNGGIVGLRIDISDLKQAQLALRDSEARLEKAQEVAAIGSWEMDVATGRFVWSKEMYRIRGLSPENFDPTIESIAEWTHPDDYDLNLVRHTNRASGAVVGAYDMRIVRPDGEVRVLRVEGQGVTDPDGVVRRIVGTSQDITERRQVERQLSHAQKMEAIGNLTGGMAHDFNNMLAVIIVNLDLLKQRIGSDAEALELCGEAIDGAERCADLIQRLLAFARRQPLRPEQIDLNELVRDIMRLLRRTLGDDIVVALSLDPALGQVIIDPAQLEAVLVNLATNARDAMPKGGRLDIVTRNVRIDDIYLALHPEVASGDYTLLEITDTGIGMAPEILSRIFEPFFTTKELGKGTGLGLSMAYGFAKQSGGHLSAYSEPGFGTTFRLYLPRCDASDKAPVSESGLGVLIGGEETILVVEDNEPLRLAAVRQLLAMGYRVREAENANVAMEMLSVGDQVDMLFTDVLMPGTADGLDLACQAIQLLPRLKVLVTSGFAGMREFEPRLARNQFPTLDKPYSCDQLARAVRHVLDGPGDYGLWDPLAEPSTMSDLEGN